MLGASPPQSPPSTRVCVVALSAVACLAEWADLKLLLMADTNLLELLYGFLGQEQLKTPACECLLAILTRKVRMTGGVGESCQPP